MVSVFLGLSVFFFSMSGPLSPYTLITLPLGIIFFSAAVGAAFGQPERGAQIGLGVLAAYLIILAVTKNGTVALAITVVFGAAFFGLRKALRHSWR